MSCDESRAGRTFATAENGAFLHPQRCSPDRTETHGYGGHMPDTASAHTGCIGPSRDSCCDKSNSSCFLVSFSAVQAAPKGCYGCLSFVRSVFDSPCFCGTAPASDSLWFWLTGAAFSDLSSRIKSSTPLLALPAVRCASCTLAR